MITLISLLHPEDASSDHLYVQLVPKEDSPIVWGQNCCGRAIQRLFAGLAAVL